MILALIAKEKSIKEQINSFDFRKIYFLQVKISSKRKQKEITRNQSNQICLNEFVKPCNIRSRWSPRCSASE